jgi:steroid delta-isomerase-like uncharacterized protein
MVDQKKRLATLREHIAAESAHDMAAVMHGFTKDCFNDIGSVPEAFVGPRAVADRYRRHWKGFPDFKVRVKRFLAMDENCIVTENEWRGTHRGDFFGLPPTGRRVRVRALVVWHFRGDKLLGETVFFDSGSIVRQVGGRMVVGESNKRAGTRKKVQRRHRPGG